MTGWMDLVEELPSLTLDEVNQRASLQTRVDRKYVVTPEVWATVLASLGSAPEVLETDGRRSFRYASTYYDTPQLESYRHAAYKRPRRFKVRTRHYVDSGAVAIEVKARSLAGTTAKSRQWLTDADAPATGRDAHKLSRESVAFVSTFQGIADRAEELAEVLHTSYERVTLVTADARVTVDSNVEAVDSHGARMSYGDHLVVETKSAGRAGAVDRALWANGIRPARISKYCTSLAALHPELPSNRWSRTMRRYVPITAAHHAAA